MRKDIISFWLFMALVMTVITCSAQNIYSGKVLHSDRAAANKIVKQYYLEATEAGLNFVMKPVNVVFTNLTALNLEGRADLMPDNSIRIMVDSGYDASINESQRERFYYRMLSLALFKGWECKGVLDEKNIYRRMTEGDKKRLWKYLLG